MTQKKLQRQRVAQLFFLSKRLHQRRIPAFPKLIRFIIRVLYAADLPYTADVAEDVHFSHNGLGIVLHPNCKIGAGTILAQQVTIGGRADIPRVPRIGKNVLIGAGAKILGDIDIGDNVKIGPNVVVVKSVPANAVIYSPLGTMRLPDEE